MHSEAPSRPVLHRAAWVVPVSAPPVPNGAVLVENGFIRAVGVFPAVRAESPGGVEVIDHGDAAIFPALVNAHTHLELTGLEGVIPLPQPSFRAWLGELFARRGQLPPDTEGSAIVRGLELLGAGGVALCADVTNGAGIGMPTDGGLPERMVFPEALGFNQSDIETALAPDMLRAIEALDADPMGGELLGMAAHACYSTSGTLIAAVKRWTADRGKIFSIHAAEHMEEMEFLHSGSGYCRELLEALGKWEPDWSPPRATPVQYLDRLGVLDRRTLLVHAVYLTNQDWETVAARGCSICFCPRSNRSIGSGRADIGKALSCGILPALGTDSLASNRDLSLFAEAANALDGYPEVSPAAALSMATLGGARALGRGGHFGSITPGTRAALLAAPVHPSAAPRNGGVEEAIIHRGAEGECQWVSRP